MLKTLLLSGALLFPAYAQDASPPSQSDKKTDDAKTAPEKQTTAKTELRMRVSAGVALTHLKKQVMPQYPTGANQKKLHGFVELGILIDKAGDVTKAKAFDGKPELGDAAVAAVSEWKFEPFLLNNQPVAVETRVFMKFEHGSTKLLTSRSW